MPSIKAEVTVTTTTTRIVELELSSPDMRSADIPQHLQNFLLRDDEILQRVKVITTDPRLPNIELGNLEVDKGGPTDRMLSAVQYRSMSKQTPRVHNWAFDRPLPTSVKAKVDAAQPPWAAKAPSLAATNSTPPKNRRSASDGDVMHSVSVIDFALDRKGGRQDLLKTPLKPRTVHAKVMKPRSPTKEEKFQAQVKFYGLPTALKLKEKREDRGRREFVKKAGTGRWKSSEKSEGAKISAITDMLEEKLYVNEKNKAYDIKRTSPTSSNDGWGEPLEGSIGIGEARTFVGNKGKGAYDALGPVTKTSDMVS